MSDGATGRKMRADKVFCSRSCRAQHSNWVKRADTVLARLDKDMHELGQYLDHAETADHAIALFGEVFKQFRAETKRRGIEIKAVERG